MADKSAPIVDRIQNLVAGFFVCGVVLYALFNLWSWATGLHLESGWVAGPPQGQSGGAAPAGPVTDLTIVSWDINYGVTPSGNIIDPDDIVAALSQVTADIVLLQRVDFASRRSGFINQAAAIADRAGFGHVVQIVSQDAGYIPLPAWPPGAQQGRTKSGGAIVSRYPIFFHRPYRFPRSDTGWPASDLAAHGWIQIAGVLVDNFRLGIVNAHLDAIDEQSRFEQAGFIVGVVRHWPTASDPDGLRQDRPTDRGLLPPLELGQSFPRPFVISGNFEARQATDVEDLTLPVLDRIPEFRQVDIQLDSSGSDSGKSGFYLHQAFQVEGAIRLETTVPVPMQPILIRTLLSKPD